MTPITMWAIADPRGTLLTHTLDTNKAQALENFKDASYPRSSFYYWREKGYKPVEVVVYLKIDADEKAAELERVRGYVNEYGEMYSRTELERRKLDERAEFYQDELAKAQAGADEMAALAWKWKYKADCLRETIRCLVVACRAIYHAVGDTCLYRDEIQDMMQDVRERIAAQTPNTR